MSTQTIVPILRGDISRQLEKLGPFPVDGMTIGWARDMYATFRGLRGAAMIPAPLLTAPDGNVKFAKTSVPVYGLALSQARSAGAVEGTGQLNTCRFSTPECRRGCVSFAGKGELASVQAGRERRTQFLAACPEAFLVLLEHEISRAARKHSNLRVRLNTFSDIRWELVAPDLFDRFPAVRFYDYTKWPNRDILPDNYQLTYSASERTGYVEIRDRVAVGRNVSVLFAVKRGQALPARWCGMRVVDGDLSDDRSVDPRGVIVGLRAKGRMRSGKWGMVHNPEGWGL